MNDMVSIKKQWLLLMLTLALLSCNNNVFNDETADTNLTFSKDMLIFDGCTLFFRGIDDCGYGLYALMVADDSKQGWIFLNAWYKGITDFRLLAMDSAEVDTIRVLGVLSAATRYDIREIHPTREHSLDVYLKGKEKPIIISLD